MLLEKLNTFVDGKYDVTVSPAQIVEEYEQKRGDSAEQIEALAITQKFISTCTPLLPPFWPVTYTRCSQDRRSESWSLAR